MPGFFTWFLGLNFDPKLGGPTLYQLSHLPRFGDFAFNGSGFSYFKLLKTLQRTVHDDIVQDCQESQFACWAWFFLSFLTFKLNFIYFGCICAYIWMQKYMCRDQRTTLKSWLFPSIKWGSGVTLRASGLEASIFSGWVLSSAFSGIFSIINILFEKTSDCKKSFLST